MSFVPTIQQGRARQHPLLRWLGAVDARLRRPIDHDVAAGHIAFAEMLERGIRRLTAKGRRR